MSIPSIVVRVIKKDQNSFRETLCFSNFSLKEADRIRTVLTVRVLAAGIYDAQITKERKEIIGVLPCGMQRGVCPDELRLIIKLALFR